jgi:hypothetical protein
MRGETVQLNIRQFPAELRTEFKILCLRRGRTMAEEIVRLVQEELSKAKKDK